MIVKVLTDFLGHGVGPSTVSLARPCWIEQGVRLFGQAGVSRGVGYLDNTGQYGVDLGTMCSRRCWLEHRSSCETMLN